MKTRDYWVPVPPELSRVLADLSGLSEDSDFDILINAGRPLLFNFDYPVSAADKEPLEKFILNYYIMRRIGSGNLKKWRQMLKYKMLEIMPYYKQLLDSEKLSYDPLINNDITTTDDEAGTLDRITDKRIDNDDQYSRTANSTEINRYLDTPQGDASRIWEINAQGQAVLNDIYLTDIRGITRNATETGNDQRDITEHEVVDQDTTRTNENYKLGVSGSSKSNLVKEYRETFLRIYGMIAEELSEIFYNLVEIDDILNYT